MATLSTDDWDTRFNVVTNPTSGSIVFERDEVREADPATLWTVLDVDGPLLIIPGFHYVDALYYVLTEEEHTAEDADHEWEWE